MSGAEGLGQEQNPLSTIFRFSFIACRGKLIEVVFLNVAASPEAQTPRWRSSLLVPGYLFYSSPSLDLTGFAPKDRS